MWYILGRSDDTIKVAGKRLGPAEIESILVSHPTVMESAVIGVPDELKGSEVVAFCVLAKGCVLCEELRQELHQMVVAIVGQTSCAARHPLCQGPAKDAQCQADAAHDPRSLPGIGSRGCIFPGQSGGAGGDPPGALIAMILVTGGTGFVGKALISNLVALGYPVRTLIRPSAQSPSLPRGVPVDITVSSLVDERSLRAAMVGIDSIFHLASGEWKGPRASLMEIDIQRHAHSRRGSQGRRCETHLLHQSPGGRSRLGLSSAQGESNRRRIHPPQRH